MTLLHKRNKWFYFYSTYPITIKKATHNTEKVWCVAFFLNLLGNFFILKMIFLKFSLFLFLLLSMFYEVKNKYSQSPFYNFNVFYNF